MYYLSSTNNAQAGSGVIAPEANLAQYFTGASGTMTLPAVTGQYHFIRSITITQYITTTLVASGTAALVTTTNLPNTPSIPMDTSALTQGATKTIQINPGDLKSSAAGTATTLVFPAITGCTYYATVTYTAGT